MRRTCLAACGRMVAIPTGTSERSRDERTCPGLGRGFGGAVVMMNRWSVPMFRREPSRRERSGQRSDFDGQNVFARFNGVQDVDGKRLVRADDQQRISAALLERTLHADDVDILVSEDLTHHPDHPGTVDVVDEQHVAFRHHFHLEWIVLAYASPLLRLDLAAAELRWLA